MRAVDRVEIIILVDNVVDFGSTVSRPDVKRGWWMTPDRPGPAHWPWAEHGFAALIRLRAGDQRRTLLFDAGGSGTVLLHNADCIGLDWDEIDAIALSHGHDDHAGGLLAALGRMGGRHVPVIVHPDMFAHRGSRERDGRIHAAPKPVAAPQLEAAGADLIFNRQPYALFDDALRVLGEIPRRTDFEAGVPTQVRRLGVEWIPDPWVLDDRSIVINVRDAGLVVVAGCAHAGLINTLLYAGEVGGGARLCAVIGGFHLFGSLYEPHIGRVVRELQALHPDLLIPAHCTGPRGAQALVHELPAATVTAGALLRVRIGNGEP